MKQFLIYTIVILLSATTGAAALKWSEQKKAQEAIKAIAMADALAAGTPEFINCRVQLANATDIGPRRVTPPEVTLEQGTQAFNTLLANITTRLNSDKTAAEAYLASVGVTND